MAAIYDIILVNPTSGLLSEEVMFSNVGLGYLESFLGHNNISCITISSDMGESYRDRSEVFGFTVLSATYSIAHKLSRTLWDKTVIWGGWTATALAESILKQNPMVDYVILQEGEERLLRLLHSLKRPELLSEIDGLASRNDHGKVVVRPAKKFMDLDSLPLPTDKVMFNKMAFIGFSRGCYGDCHFCQEETRMRFQGTAKTVLEIEHWYDRGCREFYIGNANSIAGGKRLASLVLEIEKRELDITLHLVGRPNDILQHLDILTNIFKSPVVGVHTVEVGVEANSQKMLDLLGRGTSPEINRNAVQTLLDLRDSFSPDTKILANMILFSHFDMTIADFVENVRFIGDYGCSRTVLSIQLFGMPGTVIWEDMRARGFKMDDNFGQAIAEYPFSDEDVDQLFRKLIHDVRVKIARRKAAYTFEDDLAFRTACHDTLMEFYNSGDIAESVMDFIKSPILI